MTVPRSYKWIPFVALVAATAPTWGEDAALRHAVDTVTARVVKLYGLAAGRQVGYGSGIVVSDAGLVLTVLSSLIEAQPVRATDARGRRYEAEVVYRDRIRQLALLRLRPLAGTARSQVDPAVTGLSYFALKDEATLLPGDWVITAGNAFKVAEGSEPVSLAHGVFSVRTPLDARRRVKDFPYHGDVLVIDAITSNPGGPGSAVVNLDAKLVGMIGRFVTANLTHTHFNYAVPTDVLADFLEEALDPDLQRQAADRATDAAHAEPLDVGIRLTHVGYQQTLPFVERVRRSSRAARAGVRKDDLILTVNGRSITSVEDFQQQMRRISPDAGIDLVLRRKKRIITLRIEGES
ncbi:MAG: trypsin-like peptidase domain-containing protein [Phycisphaerae bacterium]